MSSFEEKQYLARCIASSGLFGIKTEVQAFALMALCEAENMHPAAAARDYDIIQGRPAKKSEAMLRSFLAAGGKVQWHRLDDQVADATFSHAQGGTARISWDMSRAAKAGLGGKDMYTKFPRQMLRSRTVSEGVRTVWPLATSGMYVPEEVLDIVTEIKPDEPPALPPPDDQWRSQVADWLAAIEAAPELDDATALYRKAIAACQERKDLESFKSVKAALMARPDAQKKVAEKAPA